MGTGRFRGVRRESVVPRHPSGRTVASHRGGVEQGGAQKFFILFVHGRAAYAHAEIALHITESWRGFG